MIVFNILIDFCTLRLRKTCFFWGITRQNNQDLSGQVIRTPTFCWFVRIDSQKKTTIFEALGQIRANRVFSPIRIEIRVIRVQSPPLSHFVEGRFTKEGLFFFRSENRFAQIGPLRSWLKQQQLFKMFCACSFGPGTTHNDGNIFECGFDLANTQDIEDPTAFNCMPFWLTPRHTIQLLLMFPLSLVP